MARKTDPREVPAYTIRDAAHYLRLPVGTLRSWVKGRKYPTRDGIQSFAPVIQLADPSVPLLSFFNLAEAHVLCAFRRDFKIPFKRIRPALNYVSRQFGWEHPLIQQKFETDGVALFVQKLGKWVDASARGQIVADSVKEFFLRFDRSSDNAVIRLWPFTRSDIKAAPRSVFIDPRVSFGRPSLAGCQVPTSVIAERYKAGESIDELADDYGCQRLDIEEGLRCEFEFSVAA